MNLFENILCKRKTNKKNMMQPIQNISVAIYFTG